jgi:hypothetical protein
MRPARPLVPLLALLVATAPLVAQGGGESAAFVVRLGRDTVGVERFTRSPGRIEEDLVTRTPRTQVRHVVWVLGATGDVAQLEMTIRRPGEAPTAAPLQRITATFRGDSVVVESRRDTVAQRRAYALPRGVVPLLVPASWATVEMLTMRLARLHGDSLRVPGWYFGFEETFLDVVRLTRDSVKVRNRYDTWHARVDRAGRVLGTVPVAGGTEQFSLERVSRLDVAELARAWAALENRGSAMGELSTRDTVRASIAGASLWLDYGRPLKRGRVVFGGVVPWNQVWRTGANEATQFRTDRTLEIGGVVLAAGMYTLWTIPSPGGWKLVVNSETGQWGTDHHADRDLFQLDMRSTSVPQIVERFTIGIRPEGQGGVLVLQWDTTQASIPFTVRP